MVNLIFSFLFINGALNSVLKFLFKLPLDPSLNNKCWYGFPSGHMQYGIAAWGILWINSKLNLKLLVLSIVLLTISGVAMHLHKYHNFIEMIAAVPGGVFIILMYWLTQRRINIATSNLLWVNIVSLCVQVCSIWIIESPCIGFKFSWMWLNVGATVGFAISSILCTETDDIRDIIELLKNGLKRWQTYLFIASTIGAIFIWQHFISQYRNSHTASFVCGLGLVSVLYMLSKQNKNA